MFIAIFRDNGTNQLMKVEWKTGSPSPFASYPAQVWTVGEVSASGDELAWIQVNMTGIPFINTSSGKMVWYGDIAKFIAGNLP